MVITRRIEVYILETDKEMKKAYAKTVYDWAYWCRWAANQIVTHKFIQQNIRDFEYLDPEIQAKHTVVNPKTGKKEVKFNISNILKKEKGCSEQNTTYRLIAKTLKEKGVCSDIYTSLNQIIANSYKETSKKIRKGEASLSSYKNNIPIPFSFKAISNIHSADYEIPEGKNKGKVVKRYYFILFGIPFCCRLGRDRSNNEDVIKNCIKKDQGGYSDTPKYKLCGSSIQIKTKTVEKDGKSVKKKQMFLLLSVDIPQEKVELKKDKVLNAYLGYLNPIICSTDVQAKNKYDSGFKWFPIGNREEFFYRRLQIRAAINRCQKNCRFNAGGHGRKHKMKALEHYEQLEKNYVDTKLHLYAKELVKVAVNHKCSKIYLINQENREEQAKAENMLGQNLILSTWSYYNLKTKIKYKAGKYGISVIGGDDEEESNDD